MHPLNQILKYHCRETIIPTTFGTPILLGEAGFADVLFAYGNDGAFRLLQDIHTLTSWEVTDFRKNIKVCSNVSSGGSRHSYNTQVSNIFRWRMPPDPLRGTAPFKQHSPFRAPLSKILYTLPSFL